MTEFQAVAEVPNRIMVLFHLKLYAKCSNSENRKFSKIKSDFETKFGDSLEISAEYCYHIISTEEKVYEKHQPKLTKLLSHSPFENGVWEESTLLENAEWKVLEIGPRVAVKTAMCTNILSVFQSAGIENVQRVERSIRYQLPIQVDNARFFELAADKMTESLYTPNTVFLNDSISQKREDFFEIDILANRQNLEKANKELGLALDDADLEFYYDFFVNKMKRNPTDVELFDLAQSDSEHSRHWFFRGKMIVDGIEDENTLMEKIKDTLTTSNNNSLIAFSDNSSAIKGFEKVHRLRPSDPQTASKFQQISSPSHLIYSAETHNFPTAVCPFQGATTGTGGRIRDIHATGRGAYEIAGTAGYSFGNLNIPGYIQQWEKEEFVYPDSLATPLKVAIEASNGASDYGNKFGEPVICGFARSFGQRLENGERCEYLKPIMFSGGIGSIDDDEIKKQPCESGMIVAKIGGPVYRIGVGGGAASSVSVQGKREDELDFAAVQRGDAEMGSKLHRVVRACAEMENGNPLKSIHDQGAGGNGNVIKELVEGCGVRVKSDNFVFGDDSISLRELWTAEYQENDAALVDPNLVEALQKIAIREKCDISLVGDVTKEQRVVLENFNGKEGAKYAVDLDTQKLGERGRKTFNLLTSPNTFKPFQLPSKLTVREALSQVLRLPSVASKRYLTCKVDRSVTGLVAQQQCVGPLATPLADVAVVALSHFETVGGAVAIGEQPIKMLIDAEKGARMTLAETLMNLVWAPITDLKDVKMSGNWMWAAKCSGEGARLVSAVSALCEALKQVGCAIDGGKDSLSMAVTANGELVKSPGTLVLSAYAPCTDITKTVTPDLKCLGRTALLYVKCGSGYRLGGSALAQVYSQIGDDVPDVEDLLEVANIFETVQKLIISGEILAGHDVSDGGLIVALLEMAFAGNCSIFADFKSDSQTPISFFFAEEVGIVLEVSFENVEHVLKIFEESGIEAIRIGETREEFGPDAKVQITFNAQEILNESLVSLREEWEELGDKLGEYQTNKKCLEQAKEVRETCRKVQYKCNVEFDYSLDFLKSEPYYRTAPTIAIIREEGSNGDREMAAAFTLAGFQTVDVTMTDILGGHSLKPYKGVAFVGGFSYADVLGSAKGWAAGVLFNETTAKEFADFRARPDTFSFGVCNGCQLLTQLGWISDEENECNVFLDENDCGRFESGFGPVRIEPNNSLMLANMEGSVLGLWSSHGEGKFTYRNPKVMENLRNAGQICVRFCDGESNTTSLYPWNPNGSEDNVAAICSKDGRHLAMMPHSDRSFMAWQWPNYPDNLTQNKNILSPWIQMFRNAYNWTIGNQ